MFERACPFEFKKINPEITKHWHRNQPDQRQRVKEEVYIRVSTLPQTPPTVTTDDEKCKLITLNLYALESCGYNALRHGKHAGYYATRFN